MKNFVFHTLAASLLAVAVGATSGCSSSPAASGPVIDATWTIVTRDPTTPTSWALPGTEASCPDGATTAVVVARPSNTTGDNDIKDVFSCTDGTGVTSEYPPDTYLMWIELDDATGSTVFAQSGAALVDLTGGDKTFSAEFVINGGYFTAAWSLAKASDSTPLACNDVTGEDGVDILSTLDGSSFALDDTFDCVLEEGVTAVLPHGSYTVSMSVINMAGDSLGTADALTNEVISGPNEFVALPTTVIPIDGR